MQLKNLPLQPLTGRIDPLPGGRRGTIATMRLMWRLIDPVSGFSLAVYSAARQLTQNVKQKDYSGEALALFDFVQNHIRYIREPIEGLQTPEATLRMKTGDCDDKVILLAALLIATGAKVMIVAGGFSRKSISHVWLRVMIHGQWIPLDPTEPYAMGWEAPLPAKMIIRGM